MADPGLPLRTVARALADLEARLPADDPRRPGLRAALAALPPGRPVAAHPAAPAVGAALERVYTVTPADTAAAVGHPDPRMTVLASPRVALWFEQVSGQLAAPSESPMHHVGVGVVVHHLAAAAVGETVTVSARVVAVDGRALVFDCAARAGDRLLAYGTHQRMILDAAPRTA